MADDCLIAVDNARADPRVGNGSHTLLWLCMLSALSSPNDQPGLLLKAPPAQSPGGSTAAAHPLHPHCILLPPLNSVAGEKRR